MLAIQLLKTSLNFVKSQSGIIHKKLVSVTQPKILGQIVMICCLDNTVTSFDFDPSGEKAAKIDIGQTCLVSDISTNNYNFHLSLSEKMGMLLLNPKASEFLINILDDYARCRWSTNSGEPMLYVKYDDKLLNIMDTEKKILILKDLVGFDRGNLCNFIAVFSIAFISFLI